jgi:hypothetical protein
MFRGSKRPLFHSAPNAHHPTRAPSVPSRRTPNHPNHPPHLITTIVGDRPVAVVAPTATGRPRFVHFKPIPGRLGQFETPVPSHHGPGLPATRSAAHTAVLIDPGPPYDVVGRMLVFFGCYRLPGGSVPWSLPTMCVFGLNPPVSGTAGGQLCALYSCWRLPAHSLVTINIWDAVGMLRSVIQVRGLADSGFEWCLYVTTVNRRGS